MPNPDTFRHLDLPRVIDTADTEFVSEFYTPLLSRAVRYDRGAGFFSSSWIESAARGMADFAENGGVARWITSPILGEEDWEAFKEGMEAQSDEILKEHLEDQITDLRYDLEYHTRNTIAWMIADGLLEIRFAVPKGDLTGDFHDKFGIMEDSEGNTVAFHGSQNDSKTALSNYEAYTIDCDWLSDRDAEGVQYQKKRFNRLWDGKFDNVDIYSIPEAAKEQIARLRDDDYRPYTTPEEVNSGITLRPYQQEAIESWQENGQRGLFEMATGTGKTFTALAATEAAFDRPDPPELVVIAVPFTHLAPQWKEEMELFDIGTPTYAYGTDNPDWKVDLSKAISNLNLGVTDREALLTTHKTLSNSYFREKIQKHHGTSLLIGDEAHHLGSEHQQSGLLVDYDYRIGLSATPKRYFDEEGTEYLLDYFGGVVYEYTLGEAIPKFLTPYEYHPIIVELSADELEEYRLLSHRLAKVAHNEDADDEIRERLAQKRANIIKSAENKYGQLRSALNRLDSVDHLLVYTNSEQLEHVQEILNAEGLIQHKFTYHEDSDERERILSGFEDGEYDALVAMKCLDEGVDVQATKQAILMSNTGNPMQFVQRRGRVLRQFPGKEKSTIFDFIVVPTTNPNSELVESEKGILKKELRRFEEFAANAMNEVEARNKIGHLRIQYQISVDEDE
ncbi:DEAD/DEAH box helicase family protein (plasmid) [Halococcus dombrowskii]|nr:DEAD/DEAH box helicase family protein [Halococcus dombrowskii]UOO96908.1 DEAD/DEAH box helicase family protein [Halococcus dombrowskii]